MTSRLVVIFLTVFVDLVGFGIVIPLLPFYAQSLGASGVEVGLLLSVFSLVTFVCMPFWGRLSDRYGRRPILIVTIAVSLIGYVLFATASSLWALFISRTLAGIGNANLSVAQACIADVTPAEQRSKGMGLVGAAFGLGFVFGPMIGGIFSDASFGEWRYALPGWVAVALSIANLLSVLILVPETRLLSDGSGSAPLFDTASFLRVFHEPSLRTATLVLFIVSVGFSNIFAFFPLFVMEPPFRLDSSQTAWFFTEIGLIAALIQGALIGRLTERFREVRLVQAGCALMTLAFLLFLVTPELGSRGIVGLVVATGILSAGSSCFTPSLMGLTSQMVSPDEQGVVLGVVQSIASIGRTIGPTAGGMVYDVWGHASPYYVSSLLLIISLGIAITIRMQSKTEVES